jgi:predicted PurR-regulated permease PerM
MTPDQPSTESSPPGPPTILSIPGLLLGGVLLLLLWSLFRELGLIPLLAAAGALTWPARRQPWARQILTLMGLLGSLWILHKSRMVVYPLLVGLLVAFWLDPVVDRLERRRIPRSVGALVAIVPVLVLGTLFALFMLPPMIEQLGNLVQALPGAMSTVYDRLRPLLSRFLPDSTAPDLTTWLKPITTHLETIVKGIWGGAAGVTRGISSVLGFLAMAVLAPILSYYLLADFDKLTSWARERVPVDRRERVGEIAGIVKSTVSAYYRGQVLVSLAVGILLTIAFLVIGLPYAIPLGFLAGLLNLIPVLGFWIVVVLCVASAILSGEPGGLLFRLAIVFAAEQVIESQLLTPRIVGRAVGLNPALTLISVLVFGAVLGPIGVIIAVPAAAMIRGIAELRAKRSAIEIRGKGL